MSDMKQTLCTYVLSFIGITLVYTYRFNFERWFGTFSQQTSSKSQIFVLVPPLSNLLICRQVKLVLPFRVTNWVHTWFNLHDSYDIFKNLFTYRISCLQCKSPIVLNTSIVQKDKLKVAATTKKVHFVFTIQPLGTVFFIFDR